jgi:hypothetical protein
MIHQGLSEQWRLVQREGIPQFSNSEDNGRSRSDSRLRLKRGKRLLELFVLMACLSSTLAFAQITNGSFEFGAAGWSSTGGLSILGPPALSAVGVDGTHCAGIGGADIPNSTLSQTFPVIALTDYVLSLTTAAGGDNFPGLFGSVRVDLIVPDNSLLVSQSFINISPGPLIGTNGFTRHTIPFKTTSVSAVTLRITDTSPNGGVAVDPFIDDVRVYQHALSSTENLLVNGSFETPEVLTAAMHLPVDALSPWQTTDDSFEVWLSSDALRSVNGMQHLEILSHADNATVSQTVATVPGEDYALSFYHTPRPTVDSVLSVTINGQVIAAFVETGGTLSAFDWQRFKTNFTAESNLTTIAFSDSFTAASGTHIDDVVLRRLPLLSTIRVSEVEVCWETVATKTYQVQYRPILTAGAWTPLFSPVQGNGTTNCVKDVVPIGEPQRIYRVTTVP